jgi:ABC-2 type transport system permease protein
MTTPLRLSRAILKRELLTYFSNPTGYVFITLFVFLSAIAAFWQEAFFANNLANLDPLNALLPYLLVFFIPAITMGIWAEERKNGTDELLLTLPASDAGIVWGKYASAVTIYTVALLFSLSHVVVLTWLGNPDAGLMFSTYLGYWLMGIALLAAGMLASLVTANLTVAFILGALFCAIPVFMDHAGVLLSGRLLRLVEGFSFRQQFKDLAAGIITLSSLVYFLSFATAMVYLNVALLGRRHWPTGKKAPRPGRHHGIRVLALLVMVASLTLLSGRVGYRWDVTAEKIHSLSEDTKKLIASLDPARPVFIHAYLSPEVPRGFLVPRNNIISTLQEFQAIGKGRVQVQILETDKYTPEARSAQDRFNLRPQQVPASQQTAGSPGEIFMGLGFRCGSEEFVIPFFDPGLPVEYELMRSIRVVSGSARRKVGILETGAKLFGGFDFATRRQSSDWSIVEELRKQYEVVQVPAGQEYPANLDVLVAALPHTLDEAPVNRLTEYAKSGKPILLLLDPLPAFNLELSPQSLPQSPFMTGPPPEKKITSVKPLLNVLGLEWPIDLIAWDKYNPHPQFRQLPPEVIFLGAANQEARSFSSQEAVSTGLQELVLIYSGLLRPLGDGKSFFPLLETGKESGTVRWSRLVQPSLFGPQLVSGLAHDAGKQSHVLAARVKGLPGGPPLSAIVIADVDMLGEQFFQLRREGIENLRFDNVTFVLNAVDQLAGDESFIALRKRRPKHRTLEAVEARTRTYEEQRLKETQDAERSAQQKLAEAQARLDRAVGQLQNRADLDEQTKQIMIANQQKIESRRFNVARTAIEDEKQRQIERSRADMELSIRRIQNAIKLLAVALPPVPAFLLFLMVTLRRLKREKIGVSADRLIVRG